MKTKLLFDLEAKQKLIEGVRKLSNAVSTTLGPRGRNVAIARSDPNGNIYERVVVHDGVTVAKSIDLEDEFENMGAQLLKQSAQKQVQDVGDGTTVAVLLARAILEEINSRLSSGANPMELRKPIEESVMKLIQEIKNMALPIKSIEIKKQIATISAEDKILGELVAKTVDEMGVDGLVMVDESKNNETTVEKQEGMQLENGWAHELFITNPQRREAVVERPYVLVTDIDINTLEPLVDLLKKLSSEQKKIVIFAVHMGSDALAAMIQNKLTGALPGLFVKAPSFGENQLKVLHDIAIFTGAKYITMNANHQLFDIKTEDLGRCDYVSSTREATIIVDGKGTKEKVETRIREIRTELDQETQEFDKEKLKERLAKLTSGVSIIKVGGATEVEMRERVERVKDAVAAVKAAVKGGIVSGGEIVFLQARKILDKSDILYKVLYEPFKKLLENAGLNDGEMYEKIRQQNDSRYLKNVGVDVIDGKVKDMIKTGIIDPADVPIQALINASSVAIQIATTGAIVIPFKDDVSKLSSK